MSKPLINRMIGDPPGPGECKLRIKSDGTYEGTRVLVVDDRGVERELLGATAASWKLDPGELAKACVRVLESEVEVDAEAVKVEPGKEDS